MIREILVKLSNMIKYGQVTLPDLDTGNFPKAQISYEGKTRDVLLVEPYGFHSIPPTNSLAVIWNIKDTEENQAAIASDPKNRPKLAAEGETVMGNFVIGSIIKFDEEGNIIVTGKNDVTMTVDKDMNITVTGNTTITATGDATITIGGDAIVGITGTTALTTTGAVTWSAPAGVALTGNLTVTGIISGTTVLQGSTNLGTHIHSGVTTGASNTGAPV